MKKNRFLIAVALTTCLFCGLGLTSCSEDAGDSPASVSTRTTETLPQVILANKTLFADVTYVLAGKTYVPNGVTLTINAGTRIEGAYNSDPDFASALIITKGGKILANGTAAAPIIMTAQNGTKGGWGGIVLLGKDSVNQGNNGVIEGIDPTHITIPSGIDITYGGNDPADNSGKLSYVRVEYAGASISEANELNAFTFGGVGSGTKVDHCQAYQGADDAFEFFGGSVNCTYLVATACDDDGLDFDFGYKGKIQFAVATIDPSLTYSSDPNGIECDNEKVYNSTHTPYTHPVLSNITIVGTSTGATSAGVALKSAANFRRGTRFTLRNSVLYGFPKGIYFTDEPQGQLDNSVLTYNVISSEPSGNEIVSGSNSGTFTNVNNSLVASSANGLTSPWGGYSSTTALKPNAAPANTGANFTGLDTTFFTTTTYKGAVATGPAVSWTSASWVRN